MKRGFHLPDCTFTVETSDTSKMFVGETIHICQRGNCTSHLDSERFSVNARNYNKLYTVLDV
jgi:hypothetical protein